MNLFLHPAPLSTVAVQMALSSAFVWMTAWSWSMLKNGALEEGTPSIP